MEKTNEPITFNNTVLRHEEECFLTIGSIAF